MSGAVRQVRTCTTPECSKVPIARGLCTACYGRASYRANRQHKRQVKRQWVERNRDTVRDLKQRNNLKRHYGLSLEDYQQMLASQGGGCAICASPHSKRPKMPRLVVDHDHKTGKVRGLLCSPCNVALGMLGDNLDLLTKAREYLKSHD